MPDALRHPGRDRTAAAADLEAVPARPDAGRLQEAEGAEVVERVEAREALRSLGLGGASLGRNKAIAALRRFVEDRCNAAPAALARYCCSGLMPDALTMGAQKSKSAVWSWRKASPLVPVGS
jgi:hypothetical protein